MQIMKLLFDQNLSFHLCKYFEDSFPDSSQIRLLGMDRVRDAEIWEYARQNGYTIVTQDADFFDLSLLRGTPPKLIWLRCGNQPTVVIKKIIQKNVETIITFNENPSQDCIELY